MEHFDHLQQVIDEELNRQSQQNDPEELTQYIDAPFTQPAFQNDYEAEHQPDQYRVDHNSEQNVRIGKARRPQRQHSGERSCTGKERKNERYDGGVTA